MRRLALLSGSIGSCFASIAPAFLIDPVPLTEFYSRTLKDYKPLTWDTITPANAQKMARVRDVKDDEFRDLVRRGYPFIVDDCAPENELTHMSCAEYGRRFPKEHMKAEYTPGQKHVFLEDATWHSVKKPTASAKKHISRGKPLSGPYVWHVKDETVDIQTKRDLADIFPVPYFLNHTEENKREALDSFEMWFGLEEGGTQAHADAYCETTISMQVRGRKVWRLGAFPNITNAFQPHAFHDGEIYKPKALRFWEPEYEETVEPGQCLVFPMGYIHETYIYPGDGGEDICSVASTFQIQDPQAVLQWRNFLTRWGLSHYAREEPCLERMEPYVYLGKRPGKTKTEEEIRANAKKIFGSVDRNGDGKITSEEMAAQYTNYNARFPWTEVKSREVLKQAAKEKVAFMVEDTILYHDLDGDGQMSFAEFEDSVLKFSAIMTRLRAIKKAKSKPKLYEHERKWIRQHLCTSDDCDHLRQLEKDYKGQTKGKRSEL